MDLFPVYAGQGPVTLTITGATDSPLGNGKVTKLPYLIPCTTAECSNKDDIAALCSKVSQNKVTTGKVIRLVANKLTTTFFAPVTAAASYMVCIPYCFKTDSCEGSAVSWALVNSNTPIKILPANPSSYTIDTTPANTLTFTEI
eukprot:Tbor_TRINITY_DN6013_c4_g1::TRINITY_DN6013_c4_g1_i18::g.11077::m.11077